MGARRAIEISLIANAGVYLNIDGIKILIDGIFIDGSMSFSNIPRNILTDMLEAEGEYSDIDYILFSHLHDDHFNLKLLLAYLDKNRVKKVFIPASEDNNLIKSSLIKYEVDYEFIRMENLETRLLLKDGDLEIRAFKIRHMGKEFKDIDNISYILGYKNDKFLFTADGDIDPEYYKKLDLGKIGSVFVNPLFFNNKLGRGILKDILLADDIYIYHLAFEKDDIYQMTSMARKDAKKYEDDFNNIYILDREKFMG